MQDTRSTTPSKVRSGKHYAVTVLAYKPQRMKEFQSDGEISETRQRSSIVAG
jgi:hypothetical protein